MGLMHQDEIGSCDFLDVLEEAVLVKRPVAVKLTNGESFIDVVMDVSTREGRDWVRFGSHDEVPVSEISGVSRAEPPRH